MRCGSTKPLSGYYRAEGFALGHMDECKLCYGERSARDQRSAVVNRQVAKQVARAAKDRPCTDCGARYPTNVMDFDHVPGRGEKMFALSQIPQSADVEMVRREMAKCDVVCANCHRVRTASRKGAKPPSSPLDKLQAKLEKHPVLHDLIAADRGRRKRGERPLQVQHRNPVNGRYKERR